MVVLTTQFQFDEKVNAAIAKSIKATFRFYNELRRQATARGDPVTPPSFETFCTMAKGIMQASKEADMDKLKNPSMKDLLERTWAQRLLNYSTQKLLKDAYESLTRRFQHRQVALP